MSTTRVPALNPITGYGTCVSCGATCASLNRLDRCSECTLFDLTDITWVTATVETRNSQYVVVARSWGVVVTCTRGTFEGQTMTGDSLWMRPFLGNGGLFLTRDGEQVLHTSSVTRVSVHEN